MEIKCEVKINMDNFQNIIGKTVKILSSRKPSYQHTVGLSGEIAAGDHNYVRVKFEGLKNPNGNIDTFTYSHDEIEIVSDEDKKISELSGYKRVAGIRLGNDCKWSNYWYALYDDRVKIGDTVLVSGTARDQLLQVKYLLSAEECKQLLPIDITEEVIAKVDMSAYEKREKMRSRKKVLEIEVQRREAEILKTMLADPIYLSMSAELESLENI